MTQGFGRYKDQIMPLETIFLSAATWIWDQYGKELTDKTLGSTWQQWDKAQRRQAVEGSLLLPPGEEA
jgi:hypothetical protein